MKVYNKLVRDKIPEIIEKNNESCKTRVLSDDEYLIELNKKIKEELNEYLESGEIEELADLLEVLYATVKARGYSIEDLERVRIEKQKTRGGFEGKVLLKSVCIHDLF